MKLYNLVYIINAVVKETILTNQSPSLCQYKKSELLKSGNYKTGLLQIRSSNSIKYDLPKTRITK